MLTRRAFLAAAVAASGRSASAAGPAPETLTLAPAPPEGAPGPGDALRIGGTGPALRLTQQAPATLVVQNALGGPAGLRWDGRRSWGALDAEGTRQLAAIAPDHVCTLAVTPVDSGTSLLRAPPSADQRAARGLQTLVVVEESVPPPVDHDIVILLADRLFAADGAPRFGSLPPADATTAVIMVNGRPAPLEVAVAPRARLRLRLAGGSVRRVMLVGCDGARPAIVAIDGQPSDLFVPARNTLPLGPGARADLMLDAPETAGAEVRLMLRPTERLGATLEPERLLLRLRTNGLPVPARPPIAPLPPNPALPAMIALETAKRADLVIAGRPGTPTAPPRGWTVNGVAGDGTVAPVLTVKRGQAVTLGLVNTTTTLVPLRIAGHPVRLLHALDDGWDPYWRDTLLLPPGSRNHVAFVADAPGRWAIDSGYDDLTLAGLSCCYAVRPG